MRAPRRRGGGWLGTVVVASAVGIAAGLAGCTGEHPAASSSRGTVLAFAQSPVTWRQLPLPPGALRLSQVTAAGDQLLVSGQRGSGDAAPPGLWRGDTSGTWTSVRLAPVTYYGRRAELFRVVSDGQQVVALGRRIGGAHGNPRVTSWTGTLDKVSETEQPFELFGGPNAISVSDLALDAHGAVALGAWAAHGEPSGITLWRQRGTTWQRFDRLPGLASQVTVVGSDLTSPGAIAVRGGEAVVVGRTVHLGGGVRLQATFWQQVGQTWAPLTLPSDSDAQARAVACGHEVCTVVGSSSGMLAAWAVRGSIVTSIPVPRLELDDREPVQVVQSGNGLWVAVGQGTGCALLRLDGGSARVLTPPPGKVTSMAVLGSTAVALVRDASGSTTLWSTSA